MAEKKEAKAAAEEKIQETPAEAKKRESKQKRWTRDLCMRFAKRFHTRDEWQKGAPSSFKAALARGWADECVAAMPKGPAEAPKKIAKAAPKAAPKASPKTKKVS